MDDTHRSQYRLPFPLHDKLKAAAEARGVSINAELVSRLESTFEDTTRLQALIEDAVQRGVAAALGRR